MMLPGELPVPLDYDLPVHLVTDPVLQPGPLTSTSVHHLQQSFHSVTLLPETLIQPPPDLQPPLTWVPYRHLCTPAPAVCPLSFPSAGDSAPTTTHLGSLPSPGYGSTSRNSTLPTCLIPSSTLPASTQHPAPDNRWHHKYSPLKLIHPPYTVINKTCSSPRI